VSVIQQRGPSRLIEVSLVVAVGLVAFVAARDVRTHRRPDDVHITEPAERGSAPEAAPLQATSRPVSVRRAWPVPGSVAASTAVPIDQLAPIDQLMLRDPGHAGATRRAAFGVFLDLVRAGRRCVPRQMPYSLLRYQYDVQSEPDRVVVSGVLIRVAEGAPLPDSVLSCLEGTVAGSHTRTAAQSGEFLAGERFTMESQVSVASPPRRE
jgi:hypothetical protein